MAGLISTLVEGRASKTQGMHPSDGTGWWADVLAKGEAAGVNVTEANAMTLSTVWCCVTSIAADVAKLPVHIYRRVPEGRERATDHPAYNLLLRSPNPETTAFEFRETMQAWCMNWGNAYAEIERAGSGRPLALWLLRPDRTTVTRPEKGGPLVYEYAQESGRVVRLRAEDVLHIRGLGFDGMVGYSVIRMARGSLSGVMATDAFTRSFFGNSALPGAVLEHPAKLSDAAFGRLKKSWAEAHEGPDRAHRLAILEEGAKLNKLTIPPDDAQFLETRQFGIPEVCRWYRFPPHKAGDLSRATFSNIDAQDLAYGGDTLMPWTVRWDQRAWMRLLSQAEQGPLYFEHLLDAMVRADIKTRSEAYQRALDAGWLNVDEVREMENRNHAPDGQGKIFRVPANMTTPKALEAQADAVADPPPEDPPAPPPKKDDDDEDDDARYDRIIGGHHRRNHLICRVAHAQEPVLATAIRGLLRLEADKARRAHKAGRLASWADEFYPGHLDFVRAAFFPAVEAAIGGVAAGLGVDELPVAAAEVVRALSDAHVERSRRSIEQLATSQPSTWS